LVLSLFGPETPSCATKKNACLAILASESKATKEYEERLENLLSFLQFTGIVSIAGDTVTLSGKQQDLTPPSAVKKNDSITGAEKVVNDDPPNSSHEYRLPLDRENRRVVILTAPLDVKENEVRRIQKWIEVTLLVDWNNDEKAP